MPEIHKWKSNGEATAYMQCGYCGMALMEYIGVKNEQGNYLHKCVDCNAKDYYQDTYPYRDPLFDKI